MRESRCLLASIERPSMWPLDLKGKNIECFCGVFSTDGRWQSQIETPCIGGKRPTACEQKFWFGISRFIRETPNQILCSLGLPAMWSLDLHYSTLLEGTECFRCRLSTDGRYPLMQPDSTFIEGRRFIAWKQEFWFGISRVMRETPNQRVCLAGSQHDVTVHFNHLTRLVNTTTSERWRGAFAVHFSLTIDD